MAVTCSCAFEFVSQNIAANQTTVDFVVRYTTTYGSYNHNGCPSSRSFGGNLSGSASWTGYLDLRQTNREYRRERVTINHNADGTAHVTGSATIVTGVSSGTISASTSYTPPTIPRASTPTVNGQPGDGDWLGETFTIATNRASTAFTHTLKWAWAGKSGTIATGVGASATWTPSIATFAPYLTDNTTSSCTITCETYSGGSHIGTKTTSFNLGIPSSVVPTCSALSATDTKTYYTTYGAYVATKSQPKATATATGIYGSTIKDYKFEIAGFTKSGASNTQTFGNAIGSGPQTLKVTVTDTRGRTATRSTTLTFAPYSTPDISPSWVKRWNPSTDTENDESTTVRIHAQGSVTNVNNKGLNKGTVKLDYKLATAAKFTPISTTTYTTSWNVDKDLTNLSNTSKYHVRITVTDSLGSGTSSTYLVDTANPVMDFKYDGTGMAVGGISELSGTFDSNYMIKEQNGRQGLSGTYWNGSKGTIIEIYRSLVAYDHTSIGGAVRIYGTIGGYNSVNFGYFDILISPRVNNPTAGTVRVLANTTTAPDGMNVHALVDTSKRIRVVLSIDSNFYAKYNVFIEIPDLQRKSLDPGAAYEIPFTEATSLNSIGTSFWNLGMASPWISVDPSTGRPTLMNHTALENGVYLQGALSSGTKTNILGINSSNQVELNWTSGGMRGRVGKALWSGTLSVNGTITVAEHAYYNMFIFRNPTGESIFAARNDFNDPTSDITFYLVTSDGSWSWVQAGYMNCPSRTTMKLAAYRTVVVTSNPSLQNQGNGTLSGIVGIL